MYEVVKFLHVLLVTVALGFNLSYGIWLRRAAREPEHLAHVLRGIKVLDDRFSVPAYALLLVTGLLMVWISGLGLLTTFWLTTALGLYVVVTGIAALGFTPALRRQVEALDAHGAASTEYAAAARRATALGTILVAVVLVIVYLMVTKPG